MTWALKEKLQKILCQESGATPFPAGSRTGFALGYPNTYHVGMSNLGLHIIYQQINSRTDTACERFFLPDKKSELEYVRTNTPIMTIETQRALYEFPLIGFAISFEMDYFGIIKLLDMGKIPLLSKERGDEHPFVIIGGPCATFNPEPLADFVDICVIGEGEDVIHELLDTYYLAVSQGLSRKDILARFAQVAGLYVPCFYEPIYACNGQIDQISVEETIPPTVERRWIKELDSYPGQMAVLTDDTEFKDMFLIEVARGCGHHCRFCMAGYCFRKPRSRTLEQIISAVRYAKNHSNKTKVGLVGAAISDYPEITQLCQLILAENMTMSVASLRADSLSPEIVAALAKSKHKTITLAPEAATDRMRRVINKTIGFDDLYRSVAMAVQAGIPHVRLYIMIGLPFEEMADVEAIIEMALAIKSYMKECGSNGLLTLSINPFIPKPFTPFQWTAMQTMNIIEQKLKFIQNSFKKIKGIEVLIESPREAYLQAILARGDRRLGSALLHAHHKGGAKFFKQAMKELELTEDFYIYRTRQMESEILPWQVLDMKIERSYLIAEWNNALQEKITSPCVAGCKRCGVCS